MMFPLASEVVRGWAPSGPTRLGIAGDVFFRRGLGYQWQPDDVRVAVAMRAKLGTQKNLNRQFSHVLFV